MNATKLEWLHSSSPVDGSSDYPSVVQLVSPPNIGLQSDETLLHLVAQRNLPAFTTLYRRHVQVIYTLIEGMVSDPVVAEDLLLETFWRIWENATHFRGKGTALASMMRVAQSRARNQLRRQSGQLPSRSTPSGNTPSQLANAEHIQPVAASVAVSFPQDMRICLQIAYFAGLSEREIAEQIDWKVSTIKSQLCIGLE